MSASEPPSRPVTQSPRPGRAIDQVSLLRFLKRGEEMSKSPVVQAVYYGLAERVRRGEFTPEEETA